MPQNVTQADICVSQDGDMLFASFFCMLGFLAVANLRLVIFNTVPESWLGDGLTLTVATSMVFTPWNVSTVDTAAIAQVAVPVLISG